MRRKLVKQGRNALTVTLPAAWTKKFGLKAGDEVEVEENKGNILVSGGKILKDDKKTIDASGLKTVIKRVLGAVYKAGYNEVEVRFDKYDEFEKVHEALRDEFIGFETTHHGKNNIILKRISTIEPNEFDTMIRRNFLLIKSMGDDCIDAIRNKDYNLFKMIILRDKDINKISNFCRRSLNSYGHLIEGRTAPLYFIVEQLEKIGDSYKELCNIIVEKEVELGEETIRLLSDINDLFYEFYKIYFDFDLKKIADFIDKRNKLTERISNAYKFASKEEFSIVFPIKTILEHTFEMNGSLMTAKL